ncbi:DUF1648 domain-containing protein [Macrococcus hajekii]|nr:DUF1648 domain-containing protein [Macrococcus hajekii]
MEMLLLSLIILLTGFTILFSGRWVKRNILFSVYVPDEQQQHREVKIIKRKFIRLAIGAAIFTALLNVLFLLLLPSEWGIAAFIILLNALILFDIYIYSRSYQALRELKVQEDWMKDIEVVRATDTTLREQQHVLPTVIYLIPLVILLLATVYTAMNYPGIPERIAVHWGMDNKPDRFEDKSWMTVLMPAGLGLFNILLLMAISKGIDFMPMKLNPSVRKASADYEIKSRKYNSYLLFIVGLMMALLFSFIMIQQVIIPNESLPDAFMPIVLIGTILPIIIGMYLQWKADKDFRHAAAENDKAPYHDDTNYVLGLFYYNKQDPNVWVPKVSQFGMTLNMARTEAKIIAVLFVLVLFVPILLIEWMN